MEILDPKYKTTLYHHKLFMTSLHFFCVFYPGNIFMFALILACGGCKLRIAYNFDQRIRWLLVCKASCNLDNVIFGQTKCDIYYDLLYAPPP